MLVRLEKLSELPNALHPSELLTHARGDVSGSVFGHLMLDIETMGNESFSSIISIGALEFAKFYKLDKETLLANSILDIAPGIKTSATSGYKWNEVTLDTDDWDTDAKIRMLNEEDARYNNIEINKIAELLK